MVRHARGRFLHVEVEVRVCCSAAGGRSALGRFRSRAFGFARGRLLVVPSRAESLPYIVLEAAAARVPLLATGVGGIPEIYGPQSGALLPAGDATRLARAIGQAIADPAAGRASVTVLSKRVRAGFDVDSMTDGVLAAYRAAIG